MKKKMAVTAAVVLSLAVCLAAGQGTVLAQAVTGLDEALPDNGQWHRERVWIEVLQEFQGEIGTLNLLRIEWHRLQAKVIEYNNEILSLVLTAVEEQNYEALKEARQVKALINELHAEILSLREQIAMEKDAFKEQARAGNYEAARVHAETIIVLTAEINNRIEQKMVYQVQIIDILSS